MTNSLYFETLVILLHEDHKFKWKFVMQEVLKSNNCVS